MNRKKVLTLVGIVGSILVMGFGSFLATTMSITRFGPFFTSQVAFDSLGGGQPGGQGRWYRAADSLLVGDVVYISDTNKVAKSATLANYNTIAGVVVGGARLDGRTSVASADVGTLVATANQRVFVLTTGRTWMKSSNNAAIIPGRRILPSDSIAGRFDTIITAALIDTQQRWIGRTITAGAALGTVLTSVNIK